MSEVQFQIYSVLQYVFKQIFTLKKIHKNGDY